MSRATATRRRGALPGTGRSARRRADGLLASACWLSAGVVTGVFAWIVCDLAWRGAGRLSWSFLTEGLVDGGRAGGIAPILVSTAWILVIAIGVAGPLGLLTAILLSEWTVNETAFSRGVRRSLDVLAGVPSIVFGLFGNVLFCIYLGLGFSILSGGLTLACMALPLIIRVTEEGFRQVPLEYRHGAAALGLSRAATLYRITLPLAAPGLVVGIVLGIGRALAETAALIFTSGYVARMPETFWDSGRALSVHIFDLSMNLSGGDRSAYASALVLVALLFTINSIAVVLSRRFLERHVRLEHEPF